ncbi:MAG: biopolymer transporter ExbD [Bacteroidota bacterium]
MAEIIQEEKGGKKRAKKSAPHLDMTPMVDLMCLLITFFMLTTAFSKPKVMEITMPEKDKDTTNIDKSKKVSQERVLNVLLVGKDQVFWYAGAISEETPNPKVTKTDFGPNGLRDLLLNRNKKVFTAIKDLKDKVLRGELKMADSTLSRKIKDIKRTNLTTDKKCPMVFIKASDKAKYRNVVDVIDEMAITSIAGYFIVDMTSEEKALLEKQYPGSTQ